MKQALLILLFVFVLGSGLSALTWNPSLGSFTLNGIGFDLQPYVTIFDGQNDELLSFTRQADILGDSVILRYQHPALDLQLVISPDPCFGLPMWSVKIRADYHQNCELHDLWITLTGLESYYYLTGVDAIQNSDYSLNRNLLPYTDRVSEASNGSNRFWIVGSNFGIERPVESMDKNKIKLLDRGFHRAYLTLIQHRVLDTMPRRAGQRESFQFNLCATKPWLLKVNRYPGDRKAAFCISNDADMELPERLNAVFFGSSDPSSPWHHNAGLAYHGIVVSNTVFGEDYWRMAHVWDDIMRSGNTIGLHTYSTEQDNLPDLEHALANQLQYFNLRTWIDHSSHINPEALAHLGSIPSSPCYVLDILQDNGFDYAWIHELPEQNHFNSFSDISWLPHQVDAFNLARPLWCFRRTRCEAWESLVQPEFDFSHNVTLPNLLQLIEEGGFSVAYTHLSFRDSAVHRGFYDDFGNELRIRPEADSCFAMLARCRDQKGLWLTSTEELFDRLIATEEVYARSIEALDNEHLSVTWVNGSATRLKDFAFEFQGKLHQIDLPAHSETEVIIGRTLEFDQGHTGSPHHPSYICAQRNDRIEISLPDRPMAETTRISLYNIRGQLVAKNIASYDQGKFYLSIKGYASGVYIVRIEDRQGVMEHHKVTVYSALYHSK